jgi:hypothetical protein
MADAGDLKSPARSGREGSIPSSANKLLERAVLITVVFLPPEGVSLEKNKWIEV